MVLSFRRIPGLKGLPTGREAIRMMQKMGVDVEEVKDVIEVSIKTEDKKLIIEKPAVTILKVQGQKMFQIVGGNEREERVSEEESTDGDVRLVAEQTGKSLEEARKALQEEGWDLAKAILKLKGDQ